MKKDEYSMNILLFIEHDSFLGGTQNILRQIGEYYLDRNYKVYVLFLFSRKQGQWSNICNENLKLYYGGSFFKLIVNIIQLYRTKFDISYSSLVHFTGLLGLLKRLHILKIKYMVGRESTMVFERFKGFKLLRYKMMYYIGYPALNLLICQTDGMKMNIIKHLPWLEDCMKIIVIPNPVNPKEMDLMAEKEIDVSKYEPYLITAGRFIKEKGFDVLVDAFASFIKKHPGFKLVRLGEGKLKNAVEEQIKSYGLSDAVTILRFTDNVYPWFRKARICVVPSRIEGFPNVLLQMMSQNEKVVSTLCAGAIRNIEGIYTCEPDFVEDLARALEDCFNADTTLNRKLFDRELEMRSISHFMEIVDDALFSV